MKPAVTLEKDKYDAVIFDLDGVVTQTARVHAAAWKQLFDEYREDRLQRHLPAYEPFDTDRDYRLYVDGKPRYDGIQSFLQSCGVEIPYGQPDDPPDRETVCGLANRKNILFQKHLEQNGVQVYDSTVRLIRQLRESGFQVAIISASKNCVTILQAAQLEHLFHARVDGVTAAELRLKGKPAPDVFIEAAKRLGVAPARAVVVEDAIAGVEAGHQGGFGLVIGVDRTNNPERLREHGAQVVVSDLAQVTLAGEAGGRSALTTDLPSAMKQVNEILPSRDRRLVVFLDYDGTLTPIVSRPENAILCDEMRDLVRQLSRVCLVSVVSGRDLVDVRDRVELNDIIYAGSHGFDIAGPDGLRKENADAKSCLPALDDAEAELRAKSAAIPGAQIERKKYSIAIHYRNVEEGRVKEIKSLVEAMAARHSNLRKGYGKKVFELQPKIDWHKGRAVLWLLKALDLESPKVLPIYLGDDVTDEDAFEALRDRGIGIVVRDEPRPTAARYALENTAEVGTFLGLLARQPSLKP